MCNIYLEGKIKNIIIILILTEIVRYFGFLVSISFLSRCAYVFNPLFL